MRNDGKEDNASIGRPCNSCCWSERSQISVSKLKKEAHFRVWLNKLFLSQITHHKLCYTFYAWSEHTNEIWSHIFNLQHSEQCIFESKTFMLYLIVVNKPLGLQLRNLLGLKIDVHSVINKVYFKSRVGNVRPTKSFALTLPRQPQAGIKIQ